MERGGGGNLTTKMIRISKNRKELQIYIQININTIFPSTEISMESIEAQIKIPLKVITINQQK